MAALITRCPACATMFKVVPDQLRVSEGWVRCGHCGEIFDANAQLQDTTMPAAAGAPPQATDAPELPRHADGSVPAALASQDSQLPSHPVSDASESPPESLSGLSSLHSELDAIELVDELDPAELAAHAQTLREDPLDRPFELRREDLSGPGELRPDLPVIAAPVAVPVDEPGFVRQARRQARWQHPAVRAGLLLAALALAALLVLQVAVQERDRLAAAQPRWRPWLAQVCAAAGCRIAPLRDIDAIAIDGSSFNKLRPDTYRLQFTLKNLARIDVAIPALELTLTDSDEQPVVRRVLTPPELGASRAALAGLSEWSGSVAFAVTDTSLASRVAGYRLLAFYP